MVRSGTAAAELVSEKLAGLATPLAVAVTVYGPPAVLFAVKASETPPEASVLTVMVLLLLLNFPLAPEPGARKVTGTFGTGWPPASFTVALSGFVKGLPVVALCGVLPAFAVIAAAT